MLRYQVTTILGLHSNILVRAPTREVFALAVHSTLEVRVSSSQPTAMSNKPKLMDNRWMLREEERLVYLNTFPLGECATSMVDMKGSLDKSTLATTGSG